MAATKGTQPAVDRILKSRAQKSEQAGQSRANASSTTSSSSASSSSSAASSRRLMTQPAAAALRLPSLQISSSQADPKYDPCVEDWANLYLNSPGASFSVGRRNLPSLPLSQSLYTSLLMRSLSPTSPPLSPSLAFLRRLPPSLVLSRHPESAACEPIDRLGALEVDLLQPRRPPPQIPGRKAAGDENQMQS